MVNRDGPWTLWLLATLLGSLWRQETEVLRVLLILCGHHSQHSQPQLGSIGCGSLIRGTQVKSEQDKDPTIGQTETNLRVWDLKDKSWETGFHSAPPLSWTEGRLVPWSALIY